MKYIFFVIILATFVGCASHSKVERPVNYNGHPIIGSWSFDISGCAETYNFSPSGIRNVTSNKEVVVASYEISLDPRSSGFYQIVDKVLKDNGKEDCSGSTSDMTGDIVTLYIMFPSKDQFIMCYEESLDDCFGPFIKNK